MKQTVHCTMTKRGQLSSIGGEEATETFLTTFSALNIPPLKKDNQKMLKQNDIRVLRGIAMFIHIFIDGSMWIKMGCKTKFL